MSEALAAQNVKTLEALKAAGCKVRKVKGLAPVISIDERTRLDHARIGASLAGVDAARPIVWPDMKAVEERVRAARKPMSEETKQKLREHTAANPRDIGDDIAVRLRACQSLADVYKSAAEYLGEAEKVLRGKYEKLNPGQQRMVLGNRMRAKHKKDRMKQWGDK